VSCAASQETPGGIGKKADREGGICEANVLKARF